MRAKRSLSLCLACSLLSLSAVASPNRHRAASTVRRPTGALKAVKGRVARPAKPSARSVRTHEVRRIQHGDLVGAHSLRDVKGTVRGLHILGAEFDGTPTGGTVRFLPSKNGKERVSVFPKATFPRDGYTAFGLHGSKGARQGDYTGNPEAVYLFSEKKPLFVDKATVTARREGAQVRVRATDQRTYNKAQWFGAFGLGVADMLTPPGPLKMLYRMSFGNNARTLKQDLIKGFSSTITDIEGTITPNPARAAAGGRLLKQDGGFIHPVKKTAGARRPMRRGAL